MELSQRQAAALWHGVADRPAGRQLSQDQRELISKIDRTEKIIVAATVDRPADLRHSFPYLLDDVQAALRVLQSRGATEEARAACATLNSALDAMQLAISNDEFGETLAEDDLCLTARCSEFERNPFASDGSGRTIYFYEVRELRRWAQALNRNRGEPLPKFLAGDAGAAAFGIGDLLALRRLVGLLVHLLADSSTQYVHGGEPSASALGEAAARRAAKLNLGAAGLGAKALRDMIGNCRNLVKAESAAKNK